MSSGLINDTPRRKTHGEAKVYFHSSDITLDKGEWSASRPGRFTSEKGVPNTHGIGRHTDF